MGNLAQLSANEGFDDQTGQPLGEGYITLRTSAGNRVLFRSPAEAYAYQLANPGAFAANEGGSYNDESQTPTTT